MTYRLMLLPDVGINLDGGDAIMAQERLDVHPFRPGIQEIGGVSIPQLVGPIFCYRHSVSHGTPSRLPSSVATPHCVR